MTLEEAIKHCEEVAEKNDDFKTATEGCEYWHEGFDDFKGGWIDTCRHPDNIPEGCSWGECDLEACPIFGKCLECAKEHRQLAEWLRELKGYREARQELEERHAVGTLDLIDSYIEGGKR